jgi:hypothetical protein
VLIGAVSADEWRIVARCSGPKKRLWVFKDESQAFWEKRTLPRSLLRKCAHLNLEKPYRCPPGIQALADAYAGKRAKTREAGAATDGPVSVDLIRQAPDDGTIGIIACDRDEIRQDEILSRY